MTDLTDSGARLLIESAPGQTRALLCRNGRVLEGWHDVAHDPDLTDSVHRVRVERVFAAQNRATARLPDGAAVSIRISRHDRLVSGDLVVITITAARRQAKPWQAVVGARLAGRNIVLLPGEAGIATSSHMTVPPASDVMARLQAVLDASAGLGAGFGAFGAILRRDAGGADDWPGEVSGLIAAWRERVADPAGAGCIFDGGGLAGYLRRAYAGLPVEDVTPDAAAIFAGDWDAMIETCLADEAGLSGGGTLWIEPTHALTAIDLDSGSGDLDRLFAEAPAAIAAQLRLRRTGGLVVIDVPRAGKAVSARFDAALDAALADDPRHPDRLGRTRAGLIEIRIPHGRAGPHEGAGDSMVAGALRVLRDLALRPTLAAPRIELPQRMADWLCGPGAPALAALDRPVELVVSSQATTATLIEGPR